MLACKSTGQLARELASALDPEEEPSGLPVVMPGRSLQTTGTQRREACHAMNAQFGACSGPTPPGALRLQNNPNTQQGFQPSGFLLIIPLFLHVFLLSVRYMLPRG